MRKGILLRWEFILLVVSMLFFSEKGLFAKEEKEKDYQILLKSRQFLPPENRTTALEELRLEGRARVHLLMQFSQLPTVEEKISLEGLGIKLLNYIPGMSYFASLPVGINPQDSRLSKVRYIGRILPEDKLASSLRENNIGSWAKEPNGTVNLWIVIFADASLDEAEIAIKNMGGKVLERVDDFYRLTVNIHPNSISRIAQEDIVRWITEIPPPAKNMNDGMRENVEANTANNIYGLKGKGIKIGQWEPGSPYLHDDFEDRVTVVETGSGDPDHATHVAGIMIGDGTDSKEQGGRPFQWRGVAPEARVYSYNIEGNPPLEVRDAIDEYGISVSNNSWGLVVEGKPPLNNCDRYGNYDWYAPNYDFTVRDWHIPVIFSAGNERDDADCPNLPPAGNGYGCIPPPGTAKNVITVGAINSNDNSMTDFSSWGPTDDGRIKPDVVAPGDEVGGDNGITSTIGFNTYEAHDGTSMAAPAVSGAVSLLQEYWNKLKKPPLIPSDIKAVLIHGANDLVRSGPDYASGYGRVNLEKSLDILRGTQEMKLGEQVNDDEADTFLFDVPGGLVSAESLKVTLVWDDPWAVENADPALVNDLDLKVIAPDGGSIYLPWVLDPTHEENPARRDLDALNNVEQVTVDEVLTPGAWMICVKGFNVPSGPQRYSLIYGHSPRIVEVPRDYHSILEALASGISGRNLIVKVSPGTYNEQYDIVLSEGVDLIGSGAHQTIINCQGAPDGIMPLGNNLVEGFTIKNGPYGIVSWGSAPPPQLQAPIIKNNVIVDVGTGIYFDRTAASIINNTITNYTWDGIYSDGSRDYIKNNIVKGTGSSYGIELCCDDSNFTINYNDVFGNRENYLGVPDPTDSNGNISADPKFKSSSDYHLQVGSPCIDAGDPLDDYSQEPQPNGGRIDMGAYGNTPEATMTYVCGDANGDSSVNSADIAYLINYLFVGGPTPNPLAAGDASGDGNVSAADVVYLTNYLFIGGPVPNCGVGKSYVPASTPVLEVGKKGNLITDE